MNCKEKTWLLLTMRKKNRQMKKECVLNGMGIRTYYSLKKAEKDVRRGKVKK
jgi:hypothetical protein